MRDSSKTKAQLLQELEALRARVEELGQAEAERRQAEDALREQKTLLDNIITHIPGAVYWKDRQYLYAGCNNAFAKKAGAASPQQILGKSDYELVWRREEADYFRECDRKVMDEDRPLLNVEEPERQADGRQAILLTSKVPLRDKEGRVWGVLGIDTDVSELKRVEAELREMHAELEKRVQERTAELAAANEQLRREVAERERTQEALRASEERYRLVSELTSDYAYALRVEPDGACRVEWVTEAFTRMTGHSAAVLEGRDGWLAIAHPEDVPILERRSHALLSGRSIVSEFRILTADGRTCWLCDHARPLWCDESRRAVRILGAAQDVTERKQAEDEARRHQASLAQVSRLSTMGELAGQLAHELNQPLCTIVGNAQTAQRLLNAPTPSMTEIREALADVVAYGKHAGDVIRRLRSFLRQEPQIVVLNIQRLIEEVADLAEADARQHHARLRFELAENLPALRGDPIQLQQVLLNLVRNGLEAMTNTDEPHELIVRARSPKVNEVMISVSDSGTGLTEDVAARLFETFFTTKPTGLGLGLPISRSIVEAHGGHLSATANPDRGTTFSFMLPAIPEAAT